MGEHRIIVIEDQEDLAALYESTLTQAGYSITKAYTGEEGVGDFRASGADAILLDMTLPEMSGAQVLQEIRALSPNVPVIVVTGETSEEIRLQCERLGVQAYISKPADYEALLAAVARALEDPSEEYEVVNLRLPARIIARLSAIDSSLEQAIIRLCDGTPEKKAAGKD